MELRSRNGRAAERQVSNEKNTYKNILNEIKKRNNVNIMETNNVNTILQKRFETKMGTINYEKIFINPILCKYIDSFHDLLSRTADLKNVSEKFKTMSKNLIKYRSNRSSANALDVLMLCYARVKHITDNNNKIFNSPLNFRATLQVVDRVPKDKRTNNTLDKNKLEALYINMADEDFLIWYKFMQDYKINNNNTSQVLNQVVKEFINKNKKNTFFISNVDFIKLVAETDNLYYIEDASKYSPNTNLTLPHRVSKNKINTFKNKRIITVSNLVDSATTSIDKNITYIKTINNEKLKKHQEIINKLNVNILNVQLTQWEYCGKQEEVSNIFHYYYLPDSNNKVIVIRESNDNKYVDNDVLTVVYFSKEFERYNPTFLKQINNQRNFKLRKNFLGLGMKELMSECKDKLIKNNGDYNRALDALNVYLDWKRSQDNFHLTMSKQISTQEKNKIVMVKTHDITQLLNTPKGCVLALEYRGNYIIFDNANKLKNFSLTASKLVETSGSSIIGRQTSMSGRNTSHNQDNRAKRSRSSSTTPQSTTQTSLGAQPSDLFPKLRKRKFSGSRNATKKPKKPKTGGRLSTSQEVTSRNATMNYSYTKSEQGSVGGPFSQTLVESNGNRHSRLGVRGNSYRRPTSQEVTGPYRSRSR